MERVLVLIAITVAVAVVTVVARIVSHRRHALVRIEPADIGHGVGPAVVVFTSPYCHGCAEWLRELGDRAIAIDASAPGIAAKYRINATPRVAVVNSADGTVLREFDHYTPRRHDLDAIERMLRR